MKMLRRHIHLDSTQPRGAKHPMQQGYRHLDVRVISVIKPHYIRLYSLARLPRRSSSNRRSTAPTGADNRSDELQGGKGGRVGEEKLVAAFRIVQGY